MLLKWEMNHFTTWQLYFILTNYVLFALVAAQAQSHEDSSEILTSSPLTPPPTTLHSKDNEKDAIKKTSGCNYIPFERLDCKPDLNKTGCIYGEPVSVNCTVRESIITKDCNEKIFTRSGTCRFCYQTPEWMHICTSNSSCKRGDHIRLHKVNCTVPSDVLCLGSRAFYKKVPCNWTSGYKWSVAMIYSLTLGGFGIDRFYLGYFREGLGKLFSFGGLGVWTLVDVVLIYVGYVGPSDGSIFI